MSSSRDPPPTSSNKLIPTTSGGGDAALSTERPMSPASPSPAGPGLGLTWPVRCGETRSSLRESPSASATAVRESESCRPNRPLPPSWPGCGLASCPWGSSPRPKPATSSASVSHILSSFSGETANARVAQEGLPLCGGEAGWRPLSGNTSAAGSRPDNVLGRGWALLSSSDDDDDVNGGVLELQTWACPVCASARSPCIDADRELESSVWGRARRPEAALVCASLMYRDREGTCAVAMR